MRIGVDARVLSGPMTGIGRYTLNLLMQLNAQKSEHSWYLYSHRPINIFELEESTNIIIKDFGTWDRRVWAQFILPIMARRDQIEIFWSPLPRLPYLLPRSVKTIVSLHDFAFRVVPATMRPLSRLLDRLLIYRTLKRANRVLAVSKSCISEIQAAEIEAKTELLYPILEWDEEIRDVKSNIEKHILFVGTIEPRKNLRRVILAYLQIPLDIRQKYPFKIVGDKGWDNKLNSWIDAQATSDNCITVHGRVSESVLRQLYQNARFVVFPSLYEGFGYPIVEAFSHQTPVITSNKWSMPEVAGSSGCLVDPYSIESIHRAMMNLLCNEKKILTLKNSCADQLKKFDKEVSRNCFKRTLQELKE